MERLTGGRRVTVVMDERSWGAVDGGGTILMDNGWDVTEVMLPDPEDGGYPVCDDRTKAVIEPEIGEPDIMTQRPVFHRHADRGVLQRLLFHISRLVLVGAWFTGI